jgi:hypothetical protein
MGRTHALLAATALGLALAAAPLGLSRHAPVLGLSVALAKDKGGGGDHGGKGGDHGAKGGDKGGEAHAAADPEGGGADKAKGKDSDFEPGWPSFAHRHDAGEDFGDHEPDEHSVDDGADTPPTPSELGGLNGFLHASDQGRLNAAPGSAVGMISHGYADALGDYLDARSRIGTDPAAEEDAAEALARCAAILGAAANKPVSPQVVATINGEIAPHDAFSDDELEAIADEANEE